MWMSASAARGGDEPPRVAAAAAARRAAMVSMRALVEVRVPACAHTDTAQNKAGVHMCAQAYGDAIHSGRLSKSTPHSVEAGKHYSTAERHAQEVDYIRMRTKKHVEARKRAAIPRLPRMREKRVRRPSEERLQRCHIIQV